MKRLASMLLAFAVVLSLSATVFAVEPDLAGKTVILHSNDVHGAIEGYAYIAAMKTQYESRGAEVILVDAGDFSQGSTYVSVSKGLDAVELMNLAGYDYASLGNHEFDYGYDRLKENMNSADFTVLCSNVLDETGNPIFEANAVYTAKGGVRVGFFGLETPEAQTKANPALIKGLTFLTNYTEMTIWQNAQAQVDSLRAQGADIVICLSHLGVDAASAPYRSIDLYAQTDGIDFVIDAHSHTVMTAGENGELIQSAGTEFENIGVIVIDNDTKKIESNDVIGVSESMAKDDDVYAAAESIIEAVNAAYSTVFAYSEVELNGEKQAGGNVPNGNRDGETNNGDLITDAMRWCLTEQYAGSITSVDADHIVAITNGGGIRAWIHKGDVTKNDVLNVLPFFNTLSVVYVTGAELLEALEASTFCTPEPIGGFPQVSGLSFTVNTGIEYDADGATYPDSTYYGPASIKRVTVNDVNGKPFSLTDKYAVLTNNFCAGGGDTYYAFAASEEKFDTGYTLDTVVMDYISEKLGGVIDSQYEEPQGRITVYERSERLYGDTRIETAAAISREGWADGAENVIIASSLSYADSLAAVPLAYALDAPILLTAGRQALEAAVSTELACLGAKNIFIIGGTYVVSSEIESSLARDYTVERIAGQTRYETSVCIAEKLAAVSGNKFEKIFFACGENFPDALSVGAVAAITNSPILYIGGKGGLDENTASFAAEQDCDAFIIGGTYAVSDVGFSSVDEVCGNVTRIYGMDRYGTAEKVYESFADCFSGKYITIATGTNFPDALAGGVLAAKNGSPMLLTGTTPSAFILKCAGRAEKAYILGGSFAVSDEIKAAVNAA